MSKRRTIYTIESWVLCDEQDSYADPYAKTRWCKDTTEYENQKLAEKEFRKLRRTKVVNSAKLLRQTVTELDSWYWLD